MRDCPVPWISAELFPSQCGASPALPVVCCTEPCSPHGSSCWLRKLPWWPDVAPTFTARWALRERSSLPWCSSSVLPYRSRPCGAMVTAGRRSAQVVCHSAWRYHRVRCAGRCGHLAAARFGQTQAADAARNNLASDRRRRTIFAASGYGRGTEPVLRHRRLCCGARHLRSRLARARAPCDALGWRGGGGQPLLFYAVALTSPWLALADALRI
jgi:hypothetical protein